MIMMIRVANTTLTTNEKKKNKKKKNKKRAWQLLKTNLKTL